MNWKDYTTYNPNNITGYAVRNTGYIYFIRCNEYIKIGKIINQEDWNPSEVAKFCAYFNKYLGSTQLNILYKFL